MKEKCESVSGGTGGREDKDMGERRCVRYTKRY